MFDRLLHLLFFLTKSTGILYAHKPNQLFLILEIEHTNFLALVVEVLDLLIELFVWYADTPVGTMIG